MENKRLTGEQAAALEAERQAPGHEQAVRELAGLEAWAAAQEEASDDDAA